VKVARRTRYDARVLPDRIIALLVLVGIILIVIGTVVAWRVMRMPQASDPGEDRELEPDENTQREELVRDVTALAAFGQRNALSLHGLNGAAAFVRASFRSAGFEPQDQTFRVGQVDYTNVFAVLPGSSRSHEVVVIGAHYDTVFDSPGADDNASGVAGMLAVMRSLRESKPERTIHFVAFVNEEPPFFRTHEMGSYQYAKALHDKKTNVVAMLSVESIGFYRSTPGSQRYPAPLDRFFPPTANFIAVVGDLRSRALAERCAAGFREARVPVEAAAMPSMIQEAAWSDHWSFWQFGYPGVMITDTALFRNPHYHTPEDLPGTLDYDQMTRVVGGLKVVVRSLASGR
jgi:hypothetical protein